MFFLALTSICLYAAVTAWHGREWLGRTRPDAMQPGSVRLLAFAAVSTHGLVALLEIFNGPGLNLGYFPTANPIAWLVVLIGQIASLQMPIRRLLPPLYLLALVNLIMVIAMPERELRYPHLSMGMGIHIVSSILAYSVITLAACQAGALWLQDHALKRRRVTGLIDWLPPLQTMETLLFQMVAAGLALLTLSIGSGMVFLDDIFAQHLVHKTVFSLAAWLIFATLLVGRYRLGWRGTTAIRWTLGGFVALMLAYFGTRFVLEMLLAP